MDANKNSSDRQRGLSARSVHPPKTMEQSLANQFRFRHLDAFQVRWAEIHAYCASVADQLPQGAKALALAEWHYDASDPRCPHDSWIQSIEIRTDDSKTKVQRVRVCLLGAYHDRVICFDYADVTDLSIEGQLVLAHGRNP